MKIEELTLPTDMDGMRRFRLTADPEVPDWTVRQGNDPACEFSVLPSGLVLSYGGEVWPGAWPSLFHILPRTTSGQQTILTDKGRELILGVPVPA